MYYYDRWLVCQEWTEEHQDLRIVSITKLLKWLGYYNNDIFSSNKQFMKFSDTFPVEEKDSFTWNKVSFSSMLWIGHNI